MMKVKRSVLWFTSDLRLDDNETLTRAINESEEIIPFYCLDESLFTFTSFGFKKCGSKRLNFILECVKDLDRKLKLKGSALYFCIGNPVDELRKVVTQFQAQRVYAKKEVAWDERNLQQLVEKELWKNKCTLETFSTSTLYQASDLPFSIKDIPKLFTDFRKKVEKESTVRPLFTEPERIFSPEISTSLIQQIDQLSIDQIKIDSRTSFPFVGGETFAKEHLQHYIFIEKKIATYKITRNGLIGKDYSSKFSAYLSQGCLSPKTIYYAIKEFEEREGANDSTYWLYFELLWRDFFRFNMKKYGKLYFLKGGIQEKSDRCHPFTEEIISKWIFGKTGVRFVDANMIELSQTGFMSNRGRQVVASYLVNDLKCDWRYGAAYFEEQLIDYDVSSNWGNWAYIAGVGNDNRSDRYFNIEKQEKMYDPSGDYCKLWLS